MRKRRALQRQVLYTRPVRPAAGEALTVFYNPDATVLRGRPEVQTLFYIPHNLYQVSCSTSCMHMQIRPGRNARSMPEVCMSLVRFLRFRQNLDIL